MPIYDYECKCGEKGEFIVRMNGKKPCPKCKKPMKRLFHSNFNINMGVGAYGYYDETLQKHISTNKQRREECLKQEVTPMGETPKLGDAWV
jgi:putative FmdB family regulatory protein